jgi:hypothetical protein
VAVWHSRFSRQDGVVALENAAGTLTTRVERVLAAALTCRLGTLDIQIHDHGISCLLLTTTTSHGISGRALIS